MIEYLEKMWFLAAEKNAQGVFFWVSLYMFLMLLHSLIFQIKVTSWPSTLGELTDEKIREFGYAYALSNKKYKASLSYKYIVNGNEHIGKRLSPWFFVTNSNAKFILKKQLHSVIRPSNGMVTVYYNPKKPQKSFLIKPGFTGKIITMVLAILPFILYWGKYYS